MADSTTVKIEGSETIKGTVKDFQNLFGIEEGTTVNGFIKFLQARGLAKEAGKQSTATGRGKPSTIWEIPKSFTVNIGELPQKAEAKDEKAA